MLREVLPLIRAGGSGLYLVPGDDSPVSASRHDAGVLALAGAPDRDRRRGLFARLLPPSRRRSRRDPETEKGPPDMTLHHNHHAAEVRTLAELCFHLLRDHGAERVGETAHPITIRHEAVDWSLDVVHLDELRRFHSLLHDGTSLR